MSVDREPWSLLGPERGALCRAYYQSCARWPKYSVAVWYCTGKRLTNCRHSPGFVVGQQKTSFPVFLPKRGESATAHAYNKSKGVGEVGGGCAGLELRCVQCQKHTRCAPLPVWHPPPPSAQLPLQEASCRGFSRSGCVGWCSARTSGAPYQAIVSSGGSSFCGE